MQRSARLWASTAAIAALVLLADAHALARSKTVGQTVSVDPAVEIRVDTARGVNAYISHPLIPVTFSGLWHIPPGSYTVRREAHVDGRRFVLIPWARRQPDDNVIVEEKKDKAGCRSTVQHFAAIDIETHELQDRTWIYTGSACDIGDRWDQRLWLAPGFSRNAFHVRQESAATAADRRTAEEQEAKLAAERAQEADRVESRQREALMLAEAPAKRQIGATVCQRRSHIGLAGYTEQVSPDNGRIRIRIVRHFHPSNGRFLFAVPAEEHVWDEPDNWYLCDF